MLCLIYTLLLVPVALVFVCIYLYIRQRTRAHGLNTHTHTYIYTYIPPEVFKYVFTGSYLHYAMTGCRSELAVI